MFKEVKNIKEKVSNNLLLGAITLDTLLGNPSLALAQGTEEIATSSPNYAVGAIGITIGSMLCVGSRLVKESGYEKLGKAMFAGGMFTLGGTAGFYL